MVVFERPLDAVGERLGRALEAPTYVVQERWVEIVLLRRLCVPPALILP